MFLVVKDHPTRCSGGSSNAGEILCEAWIDEGTLNLYTFLLAAATVILISQKTPARGGWFYNDEYDKLIEITYEQASNLHFHDVQRAFYKDK